MRRFLNFIFQLVVLALVIFLLTAVWIVFDGLNDFEDKADVALVTGHGEEVYGTSDAQLDRVVDLYNKGDFPDVIIIGTKWVEIGAAKGSTMTQYLEARGIPSSAIIYDNVADTTQEMAYRAAQIMKSHQCESVMVIAEYYRMTRVKLALSHEGIVEIEKTHVGRFQNEDAWKIGREVVALYDYLGRTYLLPAAEKAKEEAVVGADKAKIDAEQAKKSVDKGLDGLSK